MDNVGTPVCVCVCINQIELQLPVYSAIMDTDMAPSTSRPQHHKLQENSQKTEEVLLHYCLPQTLLQPNCFKTDEISPFSDFSSKP